PARQGGGELRAAAALAADSRGPSSAGRDSRLSSVRGFSVRGLGGRYRNRRGNQAATGQPASGEAGQASAPHDRPGDQELSAESAGARVNRDRRVPEAKPAAG